MIVIVKLKWFEEILRFHVRWIKQFMNSILEQFYAIKSNVNRSLEKHKIETYESINKTK